MRNSLCEVVVQKLEEFILEAFLGTVETLQLCDSRKIFVFGQIAACPIANIFTSVTYQDYKRATSQFPWNANVLGRLTCVTPMYTGHGFAIALM